MRLTAQTNIKVRDEAFCVLPISVNNGGSRYFQDIHAILRREFLSTERECYALW